MKKIESEGNLPASLRVMAKVFPGTGIGSSEFYECSSTGELEKLAKEKECELTATIDPKTERGFLIGFDVRKSAISSVNGRSFETLIIYFVEISAEDYKRYKKLLDSHRMMQQGDMVERRQRRELSKNRLKNFK